MGFGEVLFDYRFDVARRYAMQIEDVRDRNANRLGFGIHKNGKARLGLPAGPEHAAHLRSSDLLRPVLAQNRFHLIFQTQFQLLQPRFLQLLLVAKMGKRF